MNPYVHSLTIVRTDYDGTVTDDYGQPDPSAPVTSSLMGLVQPSQGGAVEESDSRDAGAAIADHKAFLPLDTDLLGSDVIIHGERRFNVTNIQRFDFGLLPHLEVSLRLVTNVPVAEAGS